jgi:hypothetical protein
MEDEGRRRAWPLFGRFSGLMFCGSCFGSVSWSSRMLSLVNILKSNDLNNGLDFAEGSSYLAVSLSWLTVYYVTYGIEFLCLSAAKLLVLDRMSDFAVPQGEGLYTRWIAGARAVMVVVVAGNAAGFAANVAASVDSKKAADAASAASSFFFANNTEVGREHLVLTRQHYQMSAATASVQSFIQVFVLLLIIAAFVVVGCLCARRVSAALLRVASASEAVVAGRSLHLRITVTTGFVFVSFLLRSIYSVMHAIASQFQDLDTVCPGSRSPCGPCYNSYSHMAMWMAYTPEFQMTMVLISSPLALLVSLWGMAPRVIFERETYAERMTHLLKRENEA